MAANASIRLGLHGLRCHFTLSDELVDPHAVLSHELGHTRYGDARSAGTSLGEAATVARYENPVRIRNGYPPRTMYYLRLDPRAPVQPRDELLNRLLAQWREGAVRIETLGPVERLYCECMQPDALVRDCTAGAPAQMQCSLRWVAVRVPTSETELGDDHGGDREVLHSPLGRASRPRRCARRPLGRETAAGEDRRYTCCGVACI